ncbi:MAG: hypothetical protein P8X67_15820, partial [Syntrophobacterales bacterium]
YIIKRLRKIKQNDSLSPGVGMFIAVIMGTRTFLPLIVECRHEQAHNHKNKQNKVKWPLGTV